MKYSVLGPDGEIYRLLDSEPEHVPPDKKCVPLNDEQVSKITNGRIENERLPYFWNEGEVVSLTEKLSAERKESIAQRANEMSPSEKLMAGIEHVQESGFDPGKWVILLNKLLKARMENTVDSKPKLVAIYSWMETVESMAVAGNLDFPPAPYTFEEAILE